LLHHFSDILIAYGPLGVFLLAVLDSAGVPLPATMDILLIYVAANTPGRAYSSAVLAILGSVGGNVALFMMSRHGVRRFIKPPVPGKPQRFRNWFHRYGLVTVFIPCLLPIPMPLKVFVISAGILHTPFWDFFGVVVLARAIRFFGDAYLGIRLGHNAGTFLHDNLWTLIGIAIGMGLALFFLVRWNARRREAQQGHSVLP
jgi:membrane protein YqaA with SNARE-associated domain